MQVTCVAKSKPMGMFYGLTSDEFLGRIATISHGERSEDYERVLESCVGRGHESVLEHLSYTFRIDGISRACAQQLTRHRMASYTMLSQRYVDHSKAGVALPTSIADDEIVAGAIKQARLAYDRLIVHGVPPGDARYVLPQATACSLYVTMNARSLRNFFEQRLDVHAQAEIRRLAGMMFDIVVADAPTVFGDLKGLRQPGGGKD